jgi:hypothetical protein
MKTQVRSQSELQHTGSRPQTHGWQVLSSQPGPLCAAQQSPPGVGVGVGVGSHGQTSGQLTAACATQSASHSISQHMGSIPHTHAWHAGSLQPGPRCGAQQSPPGVDVAGGAHGHSNAHSTSVCSTQLRSQKSVQHSGSRTQTQNWHLATSHPTSACGEQQSALGVAVGSCARAGVATQKEPLRRRIEPSASSRV